MAKGDIRFLLRMPATLAASLTAEAKHDGMSLNTKICSLLQMTQTEVVNDPPITYESARVKRADLIEAVREQGSKALAAKLDAAKYHRPEPLIADDPNPFPQGITADMITAPIVKSVSALFKPIKHNPNKCRVYRCTQCVALGKKF